MSFVETSIQFTFRTFCLFCVVIKLSIIASFETQTMCDREKVWCLFCIVLNAFVLVYHFTLTLLKTNFFFRRYKIKMIIFFCVCSVCLSTMELVQYVYTLMLFWSCVIEKCNKIRLHNYRNPLSMKKREIFRFEFIIQQ